MQEEKIGFATVFKTPSDACREILILNISTFFQRLAALLLGMMIVMELTTMTAMREVRRTWKSR